MSEGTTAIYLNWQLVATYVLGAAAVSVVASLIPLSSVLTLPAMMWACYQFSLDLVDGRAGLPRLWSKSKNLEVVLASTWGAILHYLVLSVPGIFAIGAVCIGLNKGGAWIALGLAPENKVPPTLLFLFLSAGYSLLLVRFGFALFLVIDRSMKVTEAFRTSWKATANSVPQLVAAQLLYLVLLLPSVAVFLTLASRPIEDVGTWAAVAFGQALLKIVALVSSYVVLAVAYRQVVPRQPPG